MEKNVTRMEHFEENPPILKNMLTTNEILRTFQEEILNLTEDVKKQQEVNNSLTKENTELQNTVKRLEQQVRLSVEREKCYNLAENENKMLRLKLSNSETSRSKIIKKFEEEKLIFESLFKDNSTLQVKEVLLGEAKCEISLLSEKLRTNTELARKLEKENHKIEHEKISLERTLETTKRKLRLEEERNKSKDLEHIESKLLKIKLQNLEEENQYLIKEFDRERKILIKRNQPRIVKLEENLSHLRKWIEKEAYSRRSHNSDEVQLLRQQITCLETAKVNLIEGFELERKVFQKILRNNGSNLKLLTD